MTTSDNNSPPSTEAPTKGHALFRQSALDRLASPEQLDNIVSDLPAKDRWALLSVLALIVLLLLWSVFGKIPERVKGMGILISTNAVVINAVSADTGVVTAVFHQIGEQVKRGQHLGSVDLPDLTARLNTLESAVKERTEQLQAASQRVADSDQIFNVAQLNRKKTLEQRLSAAQDASELLAKQLHQDEALYERRLLTWQQVNDVRNALMQARSNVLDSRSQLAQLQSETTQQHNASTRELQDLRDRLSDAQRQLQEIRARIDDLGTIKSPADGRIVEWKARPGTRLAQGMPVVSIETGTGGLEALVYLPANDGKRTKPGMVVQVAPSTVKREEYGMLLGTLAQVSDFPVTAQAVLAEVGNEELVKAFTGAGPMLAARVHLQPNPKRRSGYEWSGGPGPESTEALSRGSLLEAEVTVDWRRPISYVVPWLRKSTGLIE